MLARLGLVGAVFLVFVLVLEGCGKPVPTVPPANCSDRIQNQNETDVDCGGAQCAACAANKTCRLGSDCVSGICASQVCQP